MAKGGSKKLAIDKLVSLAVEKGTITVSPYGQEVMLFL